LDSQAERWYNAHRTGWRRTIVRADNVRKAEPSSRVSENTRGPERRVAQAERTSFRAHAPVPTGDNHEHDEQNRREGQENQRAGEHSESAEEGAALAEVVSILTLKKKLDSNHGISDEEG